MTYDLFHKTRLELNRIKLNHHAKYTGQRSFHSNVILWRHAHTHKVDQLHYLDHKKVHTNIKT